MQYTAKRCLSFNDALSDLSSSSSTASLGSKYAAPQPNLFFVTPTDSLADGFSDLPPDRSLTPTSFQHSLCLSATSDVDVSLTDEEMFFSPGGVWPRGATTISRAPVAPACSRKQSVVNVAPTLAFAVPLDANAARRATFSAVGGGACVCSAAGSTAKPLFSKSQLKTNGSTSTKSSEKKYSLGDLAANFDRISNISFTSKKTSITDEYRITHEIIGVGESGRVMACFSRATNEKYALKVLRDGPRSRREVHLHYLSSQHENIVSIIDIFENTFEGVKCLLIVVEFLEGGDLLTRFEKQGRFPYSEEDVARIINQLVSAVKFLHDMNVAHRDIKLENILCSSTDIKTCIYKLGDFGFAKCSDRNKLMESPCCTPAYVCPEILSHEHYNKSCDMWAIGVVMYILLCGYPPFYSMKGLPFSPGMRERITIGLYAFPPDDWDHITEDAKNVIRNLLRTDPATRATVDEVLASDFIQRYSSDTRKSSTGSGLKTIWSDTSLSSLDDYKSVSPLAESRDTLVICLDGDEDLSAADSALEYSSADCGATTTDDDSEGHTFVKAFKFPPDMSKSRSLTTHSDYGGSSDESDHGDRAKAKFSLGSRSCRESINRNPRLPLSTTVSRSSVRSKVNAAAPPRLPHHSMSARCLDAAGERRVCANASSRFARLCSIQEEVNRALDMIRLGADDVVLPLPQNAVGNGLLERRRNRVYSSITLNH